MSDIKEINVEELEKVAGGNAKTHQEMMTKCKELFAELVLGEYGIGDVNRIDKAARNIIKNEYSQGNLSKDEIHSLFDYINELYHDAAQCVKTEIVDIIE